jgi:hypothetical protein
MRGTRKVWLVVAGLALAALVVAAAAGRVGDDDDDWRERSACLLDKRAFARYVVVSDAYERGELGPRDRVIASVHPAARESIFEPDGDLREWEAMHPIGRHEFVQWATADPVYAKTKEAQTRATSAVTREDCE